MVGDNHYDSVACWGRESPDIDIDIDGCDSNGIHWSTRQKELEPLVRKYVPTPIVYQLWWNEGHQLYNEAQERGESPKLCDILGELLRKKLNG